jgi:hypothetical protein
MWAYSSEGFVIAADGLRVNSDDRNRFTLKAKKIYDLSGGQNHIACALSGAVQYTADHSEAIVFDLNNETMVAASSLREKRCRNLVGYAVRLSREINERFRIAASDGLITDFEGTESEESPDTKEIAKLFLAGFYHGAPEFVVVGFRHKAQQLQEPEILHQRMAPGDLGFLGPKELYRLLFQTDDSRFSAYRAYDARLVTMTEQCKICGNYIRACCDPEAVKIDAGSASIGGHIHIATVHRDVGFTWAISPLDDAD